MPKKIIPIEDRIVLNRRVEFDKRSKDFPIRELLPAKKPRSYTWKCEQYLDQLTEGACVGFSWAHELIARPVIIPGITAKTARKIYKKAQTLDQWLGEGYQGTSVIAGVKAVQTLYPKAVAEYRWIFGLDDLIQTIGYFGPVVLGINWYQRMFFPDETGQITVKGSISGGHAILAVGVNVKLKRIRLHNSWGRGWGLAGDCFISFDDMARLLKEKGEGCVPVRRGKVEVVE